MPDIMGPVIIAGLPVISAVKFGDPFARSAVTEALAFWPFNAPKNMTEF